VDILPDLVEGLRLRTPFLLFFALLLVIYKFVIGWFRPIGARSPQPLLDAFKHRVELLLRLFHVFAPSPLPTGIILLQLVDFLLYFLMHYAISVRAFRCAMLLGLNCRGLGKGWQPLQEATNANSFLLRHIRSFEAMVADHGEFTAPAANELATGTAMVPSCYEAELSIAEPAAICV
jgi:hypothetical protein